MAETATALAPDCLGLIGSAADEIGELVSVLSKHIDSHGTPEVSLVARGILNRVNTLSFEIYCTASDNGGDVESLRKILAFPGQEP